MIPPSERLMPPTVSPWNVERSGRRRTNASAIGLATHSPFTMDISPLMLSAFSFATATDE